MESEEPAILSASMFASGCYKHRTIVVGLEQLMCTERLPVLTLVRPFFGGEAHRLVVCGTKPKNLLGISTVKCLC